MGKKDEEPPIEEAVAEPEPVEELESEEESEDVGFDESKNSFSLGSSSSNLPKWVFPLSIALAVLIGISIIYLQYFGYGVF